MSYFLFCALCPFVGIFIFWLLLASIPRNIIPPHLLDHSVVHIPDLISHEIGIELNDHIRQMKVFPSNIAADLKTGGFQVWKK